jgi:hypothetical protein
MWRRRPHLPSETGDTADRDFEFAWRNGRSFNRSITLSVIDVISCAKTELRAMIVQLQRLEKIWPSRSRAASIAGGYEDFVDADGREFAS